MDPDQKADKEAQLNVFREVHSKHEALRGATDWVSQLGGECSSGKVGAYLLWSDEHQMAERFAEQEQLGGIARTFQGIIGDSISAHQQYVPHSNGDHG